jgi:hypothetical protein
MKKTPKPRGKLIVESFGRIALRWAVHNSQTMADVLYWLWSFDPSTVADVFHWLLWIFTSGLF